MKSLSYSSVGRGFARMVMVSLLAITLGLALGSLYAQVIDASIAIAATTPVTVEPSPNVRVAPGRFLVTRTGRTDLPVAIQVEFSGTATYGVDYAPPGQVFRMDPGQTSFEILIGAIDDNLVEGDETVIATLRLPPGGVVPNYSIAPDRSAARVLIRDNEEAVDSGIRITSPAEGAVFAAGEPIEIQAVAIDANGYVSRVEFLADGRVIGESTIVFIREPDLGTPIYHQFVWREAPGGAHALTARGTSSTGVAFVSEPVRIVVEPVSELPVVSLSTMHFPEKTAEPCPVCLVAPGIFTLSRTGPTSRPLTVYLEADGTATPGGAANGVLVPGADYQRLPRTVTIPAGTNTAYVLVLPFDDLVAEGPEIVRARIDRPPEIATLGYQVNPYAGQAMVVIADDERGAPEARLDIVEPAEGARFAAGDTLEISAIGVYTQGEIDQGVEFFANGVLIGRTEPLPFGRPTIPCLPSVHTVRWTNAPAGRHSLTARSPIGLNEVVEAPAVNVVVGEVPILPLVRIEATQPIAEETSFPFRRVPFRGQFTITRTGAVRDELSVFVHYSGTATPDADYPAQRFLVSIPAGALSTSVEIVPHVDEQPEGIETVVATLSHCPPDTRPPLGMPCFGNFEIDQAHARAVVYVRDDGLTRTSVRLIRPTAGETFNVGEPIAIDAEAFDIESSVGRVEFLVDGRRIGETVINFIRPPDPGEVHVFSFAWREADPGDHVLTAIAHNDGGSSATSGPVNIRVLPVDGRPVVTITAADAFAVEPADDGEVNTSSFRISRTGPTNAGLAVAYSLHGAALHGVDYELLPGLVTIPAGRRSVLVTATPIADDLREGLETLLMQIEPRNANDPAAPAEGDYHVGVRNRAAAVIADRPLIHPPNGVRCERLPDGMVHLCFRAEGAGLFAIEASDDLSHWQKVGETTPLDGALHYIDQDATRLPHRFYRVTPLPSEVKSE